MEKTSIVDHLFSILDETANLLSQQMNITYLEALAMTGENIYLDTIAQEVPEDIKERLDTLYSQFYQEGMTAEDVRRAYQLALLKGMKASTQAHHQMTPDSIAMFMGYLLNKIKGQSEVYTILDLAMGTGNLLTALMNHAEQEVVGMGVEVDQDLLKLGNANANLQQKPIELFHQDSLKPLFIDPVEVVVCDPPVGYYTDEENAKSFHLTKGTEKPFSHFLMIEQGMKYTKPGGFLVYLVPNNIFETDEQKTLYKYLQDEAVILGVLQLPLSMFKDPVHAKSILILQKNGPEVKKPENVLLAELPSFSNQSSLINMMQRIDQWFMDFNKTSRH